MPLGRLFSVGVCLLLCATVVEAQVTNNERTRSTDRVVVGGTTFGDVLRIIGSGTVSSGTGTMNPAVIDADGDVLEDSFTTVSTAGAYTFSAAGSFTSTLGVTGLLSGNTGTLLLGDTRVTGTTPSFWLHDSDAASSEKYTALESDGGILSLNLYDDTPSASNAVFKLDRSGIVPDDLRWGALLGTIRPENNGSSSLGSLTKQYLTAYIWDLNVSTLTAKEVISTIGGEIIVAPTTSLTRDVAAAAGFIFIKHNLLRTNDTVYLKVNGSGEKMLVTSNYIDCSVAGNCGIAGSDFAYSVTRNRQGSGAKDWLAGAAVVNEGNTGDGNISIFADRSSSVSDGYVGVVVSDGPVAYWRMAATTSTTSADLMGNVGVATETGTQSNGLGVAALAVGTTGTDPAWQNTGGAGSLTVADDADLKITADLTIEFIAYWEHTISRGEHILSRVFNGEYYVDVDAAGVLRFCHGNGSTFECEVTTSAVMPVGSYNHYAIVRDSQSSPKRILFYVDGVLVTTATYTQALATSTNTLYIGDTAGGTTQFDGYIDEVAIYNYQLTADRILLHSSARSNDSISKFTIGPTLIGNVRTGTGAFDLSERWAVGNLAGTYGYNSVTAVYGFASGNASTTWVSVDATNGFRIMNGSTEKLKADTSGNLSLTGNLTMGTAGIFSSGTKPDCTIPFGSGIYMSYNAGTPVFCVGTPADYLQWDGSTLEIRSNDFSVVGNGVFVTPRTTGTFNTAGGYNWTTAYSGQVPSIWAYENSLQREVAIENVSTQASRALQTYIKVAAQGASTSTLNIASGLSGTDAIMTYTGTNASLVLGGNFAIDGNLGVTASVSCGAGTAIKTLTTHKGILIATPTCAAP